MRRDEMFTRDRSNFHVLIAALSESQIRRWRHHFRWWRVAIAAGRSVDIGVE